MSTSTFFNTALAVVLCASFGCKKKEAATGDGDKKPAAAKPAADPKEVPAKPAGPKVFTYASTKEFYDEYISLDGPGVVDKYGMDGKIQVTGKVKRTLTEMDDSLKLWLEVSDKTWLAIGFEDKGAKAKDSKVEESEVTLLCDIGGRADNYIMLIKCDLQ